MNNVQPRMHIGYLCAAWNKLETREGINEAFQLLKGATKASRQPFDSIEASIVAQVRASASELVSCLPSCSNLLTILKFRYTFWGKSNALQA